MNSAPPTRRQVDMHNWSVEPLFNAVLEDDIEDARASLDIGISVEAEQWLDGGYMKGSTALHHVKGAAMARLLIERGADIESPDMNGRAPLASFVMQGNAELIGVLIEAGANIDAYDTHRHMTALHMAARYCETAIGIALLEAGADPLAETVDGITCLDCAESEKDEELVQAMNLVISTRLAKELKSNTQEAACAWCPSLDQADAFADRMSEQAKGSAQVAPQQRVKQRL